MGNAPASGSLEAARREMGLSTADLWMRYFALGGIALPIEMAAYLSGLLEPAAEQRDVLVQAINERSMELGLKRRWGYSEDVT